MRISDWSSDVCSSDLGQNLIDPFKRLLCRLQHSRRLRCELALEAFKQLGHGRQAGPKVVADALERNRVQLADDAADLLLQATEIARNGGYHQRLLLYIEIDLLRTEERRLGTGVGRHGKCR